MSSGHVSVTLGSGTLPLFGMQERPFMDSPGLTVTLITEHRRVSPEWMGLLRRVTSDPTMHGGETSVAQQLARLGRGDRSMVALPVFIMREFTARDLYVHRGGRIRSIEDLRGARIGMYAYKASGTLWYRHLLDHWGVPSDSVQWVIGGVDTPGPSPFADVPDGVETPPDDRTLSDMLVAGDIDALFCYPPSRRYDPEHGPIVNLFDDVAAVESDYFQRTGVFPIHHLVTLRREVWDAHPWLATRITQMFHDRDVEYREQLPSFGGGGCWARFDVRRTVDLLGPGFRSHGIRGNETSLDAVLDVAHRVGLIPHPMSIDEMFAEYLASPAA